MYVKRAYVWILESAFEFWEVYLILGSVFFPYEPPYVSEF